jgi:hypothetical protein
MAVLEKEMARVKKPSDEPPDGTILAENLIRLGYSEHVIKTTEIARLVTEKTDKNMSRQRIASLLNAVRISPETWAALAKALGVEPGELRKWKKGGK